MKDLFIRRVYSRHGINVVVEMAFLEKTVSSTEKNGEPKSFMFAERTPEYLKGWLALGLAMEYAVTEIQKEFKTLEEKDHKDFLEMYMGLNKALKKGEGSPESDD